MTLAPDDPRHGTITGYQNHRCRCEPCRAAKSVNNRLYLLRHGRKVSTRAPFLTGPERERDDRGWNGRLATEYGCTVTFENGHGETLTLHRRGRPESVLAALCDEALQIDDTLRVVGYSTPATIATDARGRPTWHARHREATVLGMVGRAHMLHPRLRGRSSWSERKYRAVDALAG